MDQKNREPIHDLTSRIKKPISLLKAALNILRKDPFRINQMDSFLSEVERELDGIEEQLLALDRENNLKPRKVLVVKEGPYKINLNLEGITLYFASSPEEAYRLSKRHQFDSIYCQELFKQSYLTSKELKKALDKSGNESQFFPLQ